MNVSQDAQQSRGARCLNLDDVYNVLARRRAILATEITRSKRNTQTARKYNSSTKASGKTCCQSRARDTWCCSRPERKLESGGVGTTFLKKKQGTRSTYFVQQHDKENNPFSSSKKVPPMTHQVSLTCDADQQPMMILGAVSSPNNFSPKRSIKRKMSSTCRSSTSPVEGKTQRKKFGRPLTAWNPIMA